MDLDNLLLELKIISNLKEYDKLDITPESSLRIDSPHFLQFITRTYTNNSRDKTIDYLNELIEKIFKITDELLEKEMEKKKPISTLHVSDNKTNGLYLNKNMELTKIQFKDDIISIFQNINQHLMTSIGGLQNLKITYLNDVSTTSKLDMLIVKIQNRINKIKDMMTLKS
jgi:hypothetical protein